MAEKDQVFSSQIKYEGVFSFKDFYQFCHEWLTEETSLKITEPKYEEKVKGNSKDIKVDWEGSKKFTDYFKCDMKIGFEINNLKEVEVNEGGKKVTTNKGPIKVKVKGTLVKDYEGKFEQNAAQKAWRGIYEKWIIPSRVKQFEDKIVGDCDEFLSQAKAYLDLEGKK